MIKLIFLLALFGLISCADGPKSSSRLVVTSGALTSSVTFTGGAKILLKKSSDGTTIIKELTPPYEMDVPYGVWDLFLIGFDGANLHQAPYRCGTLTGVDFSTSEKAIDITVAAASCSSDPFISMAPNEWNKAAWNGVNWGP